MTGTERAIETVSDADLARMVDRAYTESARAWSENRAAVSLAAMLRDSAESAQSYCLTLRDELVRRARDPSCPHEATSSSECSMMRERDAAGRSDTIADCPMHGAYLGEP
jgi:hypothetical protein